MSCFSAAFFELAPLSIPVVFLICGNIIYNVSRSSFRFMVNISRLKELRH